VKGRDIKVMSEATRQFSGLSVPLSPVPTLSHFEDQHQVQTGSRNSTPTGSTNNLATETDIDAIWMAIRTFWGQLFRWLICQSHAMLHSPWNSRWRTDTGCSYNVVTENDINVISAPATMFLGMPNPRPPASTPYDSREHHQVQTGNRNSTPNRMYQ